MASVLLSDVGGRAIALMMSTIGVGTSRTQQFARDRNYNSFDPDNLRTPWRVCSDSMGHTLLYFIMSCIRISRFNAEYGAFDDEANFAQEIDFLIVSLFSWMDISYSSRRGECTKSRMCDFFFRRHASSPSGYRTNFNLSIPCDVQFYDSLQRLLDMLDSTISSDRGTTEEFDTYKRVCFIFKAELLRFFDPAVIKSRSPVANIDACRACQFKERLNGVIQHKMNHIQEIIDEYNVGVSVTNWFEYVDTISCVA